MSINSVQLLIKSQLDGLALPVAMGGSTTLTAIVTPPITDNRVTPRAYVWGSIGTEKRRSAPRGVAGNGSGAFKEIEHRVDIWVICYGDSMDTTTGSADSPFPSILETIMNQLRTMTMPVLNLVDTTTGRTSNVIAIGEDFKWDYAPIHVIADQRVVRYDGRITAFVKEWIQA